jgi:hypothetical protein
MFACTRHQTLLTDRCPDCGQVPRTRAFGRALFDSRPPQACGASIAPWKHCHFDLAETPAHRLADDHPLLVSQSWINTMLDRVEASQADGEPGPRTVFDNLHVLSALVLRRAQPGDFVALGDDRLEEVLRAAHNDRLLGDRAGTFPPVDAALVGAAITRAVTMLTGETDTAVAIMRTLLGREPAASYGVTPESLDRQWDRISPVVRRIVWRARDPQLTHIDRLRYRTCTPMPREPDDPIRDRARHVPQLLWPGWTVRLLPAGFATDNFRAAIAATLLLPGNGSRRITDATGLLKPGQRVNVSHVLQRLAASGHERVFSAVCALADYLDHHGCPIDYARRRALTASDLLPVDVWHTMCRQTASHPGGSRRHRDVRRYLYQRIVGNDLRHAPAPFTLSRPDERAVFVNLLLDLSEPLRRELDHYAVEYLVSRGITEPLVWEPPADCMDKADLPGREPADLDVDVLHHLFRDNGLTPGEAAARLGTSIEHVRLALEQAPLPPGQLSPRSIPAAAERQRQARSVLTSSFLKDAHAAGKGTRTIARETGLSRRLVGQLLKEVAPASRPGRRPRHNIDPVWLREQYITRKRTLPDIAAELGMSPPNLSRCAIGLDIPLRPRGGASHAAAVAEPDKALPRIIQQALTGTGAWERLRRFHNAMNYPTLSQAAEASGVRQSVLTTQIGRLERDVGAELYIRAVRGQPMQLTHQGCILVTALAQIPPGAALAAGSCRRQNSLAASSTAPTRDRTA